MESSLSASAEDYLKHIYELSLDVTPVRTSRLAAAMEVSPAAATEMLKRLATSHLVHHQRYRGVSLTAQGRKQALLVVRRHRLWETFLHRTLELPWARIHEYACRLEHGTDDLLADALAEHLDHPAFDPHGDPIPKPDGTIDEVLRARLDGLEVGDRAVITQCTNEHPRLLEYVKSLGLVPGAEITLVERAPFEGPVTVELDGERRALGLQVARTLLVRALP